MTDEILVSYILPCYNTGLYIKQCIESLYRQGLEEKQFEVIFVNNATEDNSEEIVFEIRKHHSNFIYIKLEENICAGGAYNTGLKVARGRYVQFVDSDDYLKDNVIQDIIHKMSDNNLDVLYFNIESFKNIGDLTNEDNLPFNGNFISCINSTDGEGIIQSYLKERKFTTFPVPAYRKMIRRKFLTESNILFSHTTIGCDYLHNQKLLTTANRIAAVNTKVYMFRYNPNGVTKSKPTITKLIYALDNYSNAYILLDKCGFSVNTKNIIANGLIAVINAYVGSLKYMSYSERLKVISGVSDICTVRNVTKGVLNKFLIQRSCINKWIFSSGMFNVISSLINR